MSPSIRHPFTLDCGGPRWLRRHGWRFYCAICRIHGTWTSRGGARRQAFRHHRGYVLSGRWPGETWQPC